MQREIASGWSCTNTTSDATDDAKRTVTLPNARLESGSQTTVADVKAATLSDTTSAFHGVWIVHTARFAHSQRARSGPKKLGKKGKTKNTSRPMVRIGQT